MRIALIYALYWLLELLAFPLLLIYFFRRGIRDRSYLRGIGERFGRVSSLKATPPGGVWLHAVSVGEITSSISLLKRLRALCPEAPLWVSTTTLAGRALADQKVAALADGVFFAPVDYRFAVRRVLRALRPAVVVVMETEIWPNLYRESRRAGARLLIANGRISDRTAGRYRRFRWFFGPVLRQADLILAQSARDRQRYRALGVDAEDGGNLKYDFEPPRGEVPDAVRGLLDRLHPDLIWIAASTMPPAEPGDVDEDDTVIAAFGELTRLHERLLLILVPRRPERFDVAAEKLRQAGVPFTRRSAIGALALPGVLLLDSIGELAALFACADVVFMGGTLAHRGGHNILEPAFAGRAVIAGPHMENFAEIAREFTEAGALARIGTAGQLAAAVDALLRDPARRAAVGERARAMAEARRGATERAADEIVRLRGLAVPQPLRPLPARLLLWPLSRLWILGGRIKRLLARPERLDTPVMSIGGIAMGGVGKTPFVLWLARRLPGSAILTRGYRRKSHEPHLLLAPGAQVPAEITGDEAQIFLNARVAPVGIGANRVETGRRMESAFHPSVFVLDDGLQHALLDRDLDVVLLDALDPFGGGVFPLGRLREPLDALARADVFVIHRAGGRREGIEAVLRRYNPRAPVFYSSVVPECWVEAASGIEIALDRLPHKRIAAFCGLANPASFWQTCRRLAVKPVVRREFPDHHRYSVRDLQPLADSADALITTEKDRYNLPRVPWPVYYLRVTLAVDDEKRLLDLAEASRSSRKRLRSSPPP